MLIKLFIRIKIVYNYLRLRLISDEKFIINQYEKHLGVKPNLVSPRLFTEKIQWLKLNYRNELYPICADKYQVRDYVTKKIGEQYLIPLIFASNNPIEILKKKLPKNFIIKTNHTSGYNLIVKNGYMTYFDRKELYDVNKISKILKKWLKANVFYANREWEYKNISPKYLVEELLEDESGNKVLNDYKIHCFNGIPTYIQTIFDRNEGVKEDWYSTNWDALDISYFSNYRKIITKPNNLSKMLEIASVLSKDFIYVRVDLYSINDKIYFGELTFHPYSGVMSFSPKVWDSVLGEKIKLPIVN